MSKSITVWSASRMDEATKGALFDLIRDVDLEPTDVFEIRFEEDSTVVFFYYLRDEEGRLEMDSTSRARFDHKTMYLGEGFNHAQFDGYYVDPKDWLERRDGDFTFAEEAEGE